MFQLGGPEMSKKRERDRRQLRREHLHLPLQVNCVDKQSGWVAATLLDVSPGGLGVSLPETLPLNAGDPIDLRFPLSDTDNYEIGTGIVCHIESPQDGHKIIGISLQKQNLLFAGVSMLGISPQILEIKSLLPTLTNTDLNVLISGETGTGKNILAQLIHRTHRGEQLPFIRVNCPSIPDSLFESEMFGHEKGAYTDAKTSTPGYFRLAGEGTILLDEISEIEPHLQAKLLSVIEERQFLPVGGDKQIPVRANIIATTNRDLEQAVREGCFRQDLYYRLCEMPFHLPPLRERKNDIILLANFFLHYYSGKFQRPPRILNGAEMELLKKHSWPGNIRELENNIKQTAALGKFVGPQMNESQAGNEFDASNFPQDFFGNLLNEHQPLPELVKNISEKVERVLILRELEKCGQNKTLAAKQLGISYRTLLRKLNMF